MKCNIIFSNKSLCILLLMILCISSTALSMEKYPIKKPEKNVLEYALVAGSIGAGASLIITGYSQRKSSTFTPSLHIIPAVFNFGCGFVGGALYTIIDNANTQSQNKAIEEIVNPPKQDFYPIKQLIKTSNKQLTKTSKKFLLPTLEQINIE